MSSSRCGVAPGMKEPDRVFQTAGDTAMMREFVGFGAYEAACKLDEGLQGWKPVVVGLQFDLSDSEVFQGCSRWCFRYMPDYSQ